MQPESNNSSHSQASRIVGTWTEPHSKTPAEVFNKHLHSLKKQCCDHRLNPVTDLGDISTASVGGCMVTLGRDWETGVKTWLGRSPMSSSPPALRRSNHFSHRLFQMHWRLDEQGRLQQLPLPLQIPSTNPETLIASRGESLPGQGQRPVLTSSKPATPAHLTAIIESAQSRSPKVPSLGVVF